MFHEGMPICEEDPVWILLIQVSLGSSLAAHAWKSTSSQLCPGPSMTSWRKVPGLRREHVLLWTAGLSSNSGWYFKRWLSVNQRLYLVAFNPVTSWGIHMIKSRLKVSLVASGVSKAIAGLGSEGGWSSLGQSMKFLSKICYRLLNWSSPWSKYS